jgi:hypothetical protein
LSRYEIINFYLIKRKKFGPNIVLPEAAAWFSCAVTLVLHKRQGIASPANHLLLNEGSDSSRLLVKSRGEVTIQVPSGSYTD